MTAPSSGVEFLLISVTSEPVIARGDTGRMIASIRDQECPSRIVLVTRDVSPATMSGWPAVPDLVLPLADPIALSCARNVALNAAADRGWLSGVQYVSFPDDDSWYPQGLLPAVARQLNANVACVIVDYRPDAPDSIVGIHSIGKPLQRHDVFRLATSNNSFFRADIFGSGLRFDERLGLGAMYGSSEDLDIALSAASRGGVLFVPGLVVGHPLTPQKAAQYFPGNIAVLAKHARSAWWARNLLVRQIAVGLVRWIQGRLPARYVVVALRAAWQMIFESGDGK